MNGKRRSFGTILVIAGVALVALVFVQGCKEEPAAQQQSAQAPDHSDMDGHSHAADEVMAKAEGAAEAVEATGAAATEQTICPVMAGNPIDKAIFVEYEGKKVYFCCAMCEDKFLADPAQYVAKLPQFQE